MFTSDELVKIQSQLHINKCNLPQCAITLTNDLIDEIMSLRMALFAIAEPVAYLQSITEEDEDLDLQKAAEITHNPEYLKGIARTALYEPDESAEVMAN